MEEEKDWKYEDLCLNNQSEELTLFLKCILCNVIYSDQWSQVHILWPL